MNSTKKFHSVYIAAPIVTYILGPKSPGELPGYENVDLSTGGELCENITYLGKVYYYF